MSRFRKRPVVIEAVQYPCEHPAVRRCDCDAVGNCACGMCGKAFIETLEGRMVVSDGDWIIRGVKGEFYPCKPDIFAATYEPAHDNGVSRIAAERDRHQRHPSEGGEGWTRQHDRQEHDNRALALAGACYALQAGAADLVRDYHREEGGAAPGVWPWGAAWWKPGADNSDASRIRELEKAGALIAAEIDRLLGEDAP